MEIGDIVVSPSGVECKIVEIYIDGSCTMARAKPFGREIRNEYGLYSGFSDPIEVMEKRLKGAQHEQANT